MSVVARQSSDEQPFVDFDAEFVEHFRCPSQFAGFILSPADVVQNLRYERYVQPATGMRLRTQAFVREAYYLARPLLGVAVRRHLQRIWFRNWQRIEFPRWPVDATVNRLFEQMMALALRSHGVSEIPFVWFWPDGAPSATVMTHDVETEAGRDFCQRLIDIDESFGVTSSFQIVPESRYTVTPWFLDDIRERGCEVNVHDLNHDGRLFLDRAEFDRRARRINMYARRFGAAGFRAAAMYRNLDWLQTLDFSYDMSVPCVGHLEAQRGGCCSVFPFFAGRMIELPLTTTQDYSLFQILGDHSIDLWKKQLDLVGERHGMASFITHPDYLLEHRPRETYKELLHHVRETSAKKRTWLTLPGAISRWWRDRSRMSVVPCGNTWSVAGPGKERARVAFAGLDAGRIVYRLQSILALLVLDNATAEAAADASFIPPEMFPFPLIVMLALAHLCSRMERPIDRTRQLLRRCLSRVRSGFRRKPHAYGCACTTTPSFRMITACVARDADGDVDLLSAA